MADTPTTGNDTINGTANNDTIDALAGNDWIYGKEGNDSLKGGEGSDILAGDAGNDTLDGGTHGSGWGDFAAFLSATAGISVDLTAGTASDGLGGTDTLIGIEGVYDTAFNDTLKGSSAQDFFFLNWGGNDTVDGQGGSDYVIFNSSVITSGVTVDLLAGTASGAFTGTDKITSIENVQGTFFDDKLTLANFEGGSAYGWAGNDVLTGGGLSDNLRGGSGNDTLIGGASPNGADAVLYHDTESDGGGKTLTGKGVTVNLNTGTATDNWGDTDTISGIEFVGGSSLNDALTGGNPANGSASTDGFEGFRGLGGDDTIDGGTGFDRAYYDNSPAAVTVTLGGTSNGTAADGWGGTDTLINIEEVRGSAFVDVLTGSDSGGFESFEGRAGNDVIDGKGGQDRASYQTSPAAVVVDLTLASASDGFGGTDTLRNVERVRGSAYNDKITGDTNNNNLEGLGGDDTLDGGAGTLDVVNYESSPSAVTVNLETGVATGGSGNDVLSNLEVAWGSAFDDTLVGNAQNNGVRGGGGNDVIDGSAGTDAALFKGARSLYTVTAQANGRTVTSSAEGTDTLSNIERLYFSDQRVAFDTTGTAGDGVLVLSALMGKAAVQNMALAGIAITYADSAGSLSQLAETVVSSGIAAGLAGGADHTSLAKLLMRNVLGSDADAGMVGFLVTLLNNGTFTPASLLATAATLDANRIQIDLTGLAQTGIVYTV
jgi:Ca2+-binding RTX toxin-like protein